MVFKSLQQRASSIKGQLYIFCSLRKRSCSQVVSRFTSCFNKRSFNIVILFPFLHSIFLANFQILLLLLVNLIWAHFHGFFSFFRLILQFILAKIQWLILHFYNFIFCCLFFVLLCISGLILWVLFLLLQIMIHSQFDFDIRMDF